MRLKPFEWSRAAVCAVALFALGGCATTHKSLEKVAKDWCETIRASQVICVYPLTEDLVPGDVFLVQTTVAEEQTLYRQKGFLPLSDHRKRLGLGKDQYLRFYTSGYWKDDFGRGVPNERPKRPGAAPAKEGESVGLSEANAPRAVFPSYSFQVENRSGLSLAVPVKGVPVGLNYLQADSADGSLIIGDARSYGVDSLQAYRAVQDWLEKDPAARWTIQGTVKQARAEFLLLRVVTRVYLTGGMVVSLTRSDTRGTDLAVGKAPDLSLTTAGGEINQAVAATLSALEAKANPLDIVSMGGRVRFISASSSSVTLAESFDRLLAVGYLAVDVPFFANGVLGYPVPTFERLESIVATQPILPAGELSSAQRQYKVDESALDALAAKDRKAATAVMEAVVSALDAREFRPARAALARSKADPSSTTLFEEALGSFKLAAAGYVTAEGDSGLRYDRYAEAFALAFTKHSGL